MSDFTLPNLDAARPMVAYLGLGLAAAAAAIVVLSRPGARFADPDQEYVLDRAEFAFRRALAAFHPRKGGLWHRWALKTSSPARAVACMEEAARRDHPEAHFELGLFYEEGGHGPGGRDRAARHYRAAADLGHLEAAYRLAELLRWGIGPARDPGAAHRWYLRSANGGFRPAMDWLVRAFEFGEGIPEDLEKAVYWTVQAQALPPAGLRISHFAKFRKEGAAPFTWARQEENEAWNESSGGRNRAPARSGAEGETFFRMGMGFLGGAQHPRDPIAARIWLLRAAEAGHVEAMAELADLLAWGVGGLAHSREAHFWFQRAGKAGHKGAQIRLGQLEAPGKDA